MEKKVRVSRLQAGDILLLEPSEDWISKLIVKITKSPVSHTALSCGQAAEVGTVIEETPPSAVKDSILSRTGRTAYVMRLRSEAEDFQPVMDVAGRYVREKLPYANAQLPFIALYCLVFNITGGKRLQGFVTRLMGLALGIVMEMENQSVYGGKEAMMCSQFAYHCYKETGKKYEIRMKADKITGPIDRMLQMVSRDLKKYNDQVFGFRTDPVLIRDEEVTEVLSGLYGELENGQDGQLLLGADFPPDDFIVGASRFCVRFVKAYSKDGRDMAEKDIVYYWEKLKEMEEYFITPGDLLSNTENLVCQGTVDYEGFHGD
ncbi:hypothetical protein AALB39_11140 [Lachnospiraceae bacterium 54-53]